MRRTLTGAILAAVLVAVASTAAAGPKVANPRHELPCWDKQMERIVRCLVREPGINPDGGAAKALAILDCETSISDSARAKYLGRWQLLRREYKAFSKQGPRWLDEVFHDEALNGNFGPGNPWSSTAAVLAHRRWEWSSCK